jgi:Uma2 family endonuclease
MAASVFPVLAEPREAPLRRTPESQPTSLFISPELRQQLLEALLAAPAHAPAAMSYAEFLDHADEDTLAEWVNGEMIITSPASNRHQDVVSFLDNILRPYAEERGLGIVRTAPFQVKLEHGREPDLIFVAQEHLDRLLENRVEGAPDLVVEIISPESVARDRGEKFNEYERGGVPEYWLVDPQVRWVAVYNLDDAGRYQPTFTGAAGVFHSQAVKGLWLRAEWFWQPPRVVQVLRELDLV